MYNVANIKKSVMPTAKHRKEHKQKLVNFKQKQKEQMQEKQVPQMPPYRNIPTWDKNAKIEILGYEWEVIYNTVAQMQLLGQATNAVMSRNIVNGTINMDFEKLDPQTLEYGPMTDEEKQPLLEEFQNTIQAIKDRANSIPVKSEAAVVDDSVNTADAEVKPAKKKKEAKVVALA